MDKFQDKLTQNWVKLTGRTFNPNQNKWLVGPIGETDIIKDKFIQTLIQQEGLDIEIDPKDSGLLDSFSDLELTVEESEKINKKIVDFYEKTSNYNFEIWSEWKAFFRPFGKALSLIFSKRLQQLNLPLSALDSSQGIESQIIKLSENGVPKWTIWYRKSKRSGDVIYSGIYTTTKLPNLEKPLLKVVFPLPNGNASVIMSTSVLDDGSLLLSSDGKHFGDNGFYFTLTNNKGKYWAKFIKPMHEWIKVYVDKENILRADHNLNFYGINFLKLHYKMTQKSLSP